LKACLERWFTNPKDLHLTDPRQPYPFKFQKWLDASYYREGVRTFVLKQDHWIIGHVSLQILPHRRRAHLFHLFVDREFRGRGYGKRLISHVESVAKKLGLTEITLRVVPENEHAIRIYRRLGFKPVGVTRSQSLKFKKQLTGG
jgi:ribosomal-protein-alanine N-acetyltransferase